MSYRLGVDVGGTFTDLLLINEENGETWTAKVPSTPEDSSVGVLNGVARICEESGVNPAEIELVMHGTTVATNAVLTGRGARVGLVTTAGYEHTLQVARSFCPGGLGGWVTFVKKPLLAPLELTIGAGERISATGEVIEGLDEAALRADLEALHAKGGIEALTICFVNAYLNGEHEQRAAAIAQDVFGEVPISISSEVVPEMQEYERTETTVVNSYVRPEVSKYVENLQASLADKLGSETQLSILRSDGGLASGRAAAESPVNLLMSGPAGGVAGAMYFCSRAGFDNILTFDMGGTSTDVALIQNGRARVRRETFVGDVKVRAPSVDVRTVGAGGGSIAFVPELTRALRVGPESAGAVPGPACYMKGGEQPTVCDANVVLGYLPSDVQLGGAMEINRDAAVSAVQKTADAMGISLEDAAEGIIKVVNESMFGALRLVSVEQGYDPRDFSLVGFGGAGPLHANAVAQLMGSFPVLIPPGPGLLCAVGDLVADFREEFARTFIRNTDQTSIDEVVSILEDLGRQAQAWLEKEGQGEQEITFSVDTRYYRQGYEMPVTVTLETLRAEGLAMVEEGFHALHEQLYGFRMEGTSVEIVNLRAVGVGRVPEPSLADREDEGGADSSEAFVRDHKVFSHGRWLDAKIYDRARLRPGHRVQGPAIITEFDSTSVVLEGFTARIDAYRNILIDPTEA